MEFGKAKDNEIKINPFVFPKTSSCEYLSVTLNQDKKIYVGLPKWSQIHPPQAPDKDALKYYCKVFNTVELNATHYKLPTKEQVLQWKDKISVDGFLFCPKMFKEVTHSGNLLGKETVTNEFLDAILSFGNTLGPILIQMRESFSPIRKNELFTFLEGLPRNFRFFLEVSHKEWFDNYTLPKGLIDKLQGLNMGAVITDSPSRRDAIHMQPIIPTTCIRFMASGHNEVDLFRIQQWKQQLSKWFGLGLKEAYFFVHMPYEDSSVDFAKYVRDQLVFA